MSEITYQDFSKVDMRVGTILSAEVFKEARNPAYKIVVDFGELGTRKTSAQITKRYEPTELVGKQVIGVVNFPAKQIANIMSECLLLGAVGDENDVILLRPETFTINGLKIG